MPRGSSGRVIIEISPYLKRQLYEILDADGLTLKAWFLTRVNEYLVGRLHPSLFPLANSEKERDDEF